jgi:hypothetical protein
MALNEVKEQAGHLPPIPRAPFLHSPPSSLFTLSSFPTYLLSQFTHTPRQQGLSRSGPKSGGPPGPTENRDRPRPKTIYRSVSDPREQGDRARARDRPKRSGGLSPVNLRDRRSARDRLRPTDFCSLTSCFILAFKIDCQATSIQTIKVIQNM